VTLPLFPSRDLERAQTAYRLVNDLKIALPVAALLLLALGVYIARGHRRALIVAGLGLAAAMVVLGAALLIIRGGIPERDTARRAVQRRRGERFPPRVTPRERCTAPAGRPGWAY
jgi:hypothetical protein